MPLIKIKLIDSDKSNGRSRPMIDLNEVNDLKAV